MSKIKEMFGSMVFNDSVMKERLPHADYKALRRAIESGRELNRDIADVVANAMKDWAIEKPFYPLVSAHERRDRRKARCVHHARQQQRGHHGILRQGAGQGRS